VVNPHFFFLPEIYGDSIPLFVSLNISNARNKNKAEKEK